MNLDETRKYIERRMGDVGLNVRIDNSGYQAMQNYTGGDNERLNQLYYKLVSVGSRQEKREVNGVTIQIAIDDLRRMDEFMDHLPMRIEQNDKIDADRITIEQLASSLEQRVAEEIELAVGEARRKGAITTADAKEGPNGVDHAPSIPERIEAVMVTAGTSGKPCILIVDDSPTIRAAVTKALENDFELIQASDGEKGWEALCANSNIKLVVTDLMMPGMDGFGLIERIRSARVPGVANLPIIVVTALEDPQAKVHALVAGANDFITKRTDTLELQARVVARYQLSQIVGNAPYPNGPRAPKEAGPPPQEIAAALLGTRTPTAFGKHSLNIAGSARRLGKSSRASSNEFTPISTPRDDEPTERKDVERPGLPTWIRAIGLDRLARMSATTGITVVASVLVVATILGILYMNRVPIASTAQPGDSVKGAIIAGEASLLLPDSAQSPTTDATATNPDDAKAADAASADSWTTADGSPAREKLTPSPVQVSKRDSLKGSATTAADLVSTPAKRDPASDNVTKSSVTLAQVPRAAATESATSAAEPKPSTTKAAPISPPSTPVPSPPVVGVDSKPATDAVTNSASTSLQVPAVAAAATPTAAEPTATTVPSTAAATAESATDPRGVAPDSQVATIGPPRAEAPPIPSTKLTKAELASLVNRFVFVYQAGDIQQFLSLFDDNIRTNDRSTKAGLREDYEELFRSTAMRQMVLGDIAWDIKDRQAEGAANFEVRVRRANDDELKVYQGSLTFHVEKVGGRIRIIRMYHGQWKAQS